MVYEKIIPHFPSLSKFTLKISSYLLLVPISAVVPKFFLKFHEIIIKIFQKFVVNVSKTFLTFLFKNFFNLSEISWIVILYGTSMDTGIDTTNTFCKSIDTKVFWYFSITICSVRNVNKNWYRYTSKSKLVISILSKSILISNQKCYHFSAVRYMYISSFLQNKVHNVSSSFVFSVNLIACFNEYHSLSASLNKSLRVRTIINLSAEAKWICKYECEYDRKYE